MDAEKEEILELKIEIERLREYIIHVESLRDAEIKQKENEISDIRDLYEADLAPFNIDLADAEAELKRKLLALR